MLKSLSLAPFCVTRWLALHVILAGGLVGAELIGWLRIPFEGDATHMTLVIAVWSGAGATLMLWGRRRYVAEIADSCMVLGLLGTILGIVIATQGGIDRIDIAGVGTALFTTLVGGLSYLWLRILLAIIQER